MLYAQIAGVSIIQFETNQLLDKTQEESAEILQQKCEVTRTARTKSSIRFFYKKRHRTSPPGRPLLRNADGVFFYKKSG
jgi:hypothetical protein